MKCSNWDEYKEDDNWGSILDQIDCLIVGNHYEIDDRCKFLGDKFEEYNKSIYVFNVIYPQTGTPKFYLDNEELSVIDLNGFIQSKEDSQSQLLIDISTFDLPELYHFLKSCNDILTFARIAYSEPKGYAEGDTKERSSLQTNHFLSEDGNGLDYLSSCDILPYKDKRYLISIGYESHRLAGFLGSDEIKTEDNKAVIIGIPPFNVGWENHTIRNNYQILNTHNADIHIAPADDPVRTYLSVFEAHQELSSSENLVLMPIGPKPQALGMIWFAIDKNTGPVAEVGIQYDFVQKVQKRTSGISKVHVWNFKFK